MADDLTVRSEARGDAVVLWLEGDVDVVTAPVVNEAIKNALQERPRVLVVELSGVGFLASAGLSELVVGHRLAGERTEFLVVAPGRATSRPLEAVGLTETFGVFPTLDDALASPE